jgi:hypothetical protein
MWFKQGMSKLSQHMKNHEEDSLFKLGSFHLNWQGGDPYPHTSLNVAIQLFMNGALSFFIFF